MTVVTLPLGKEAEIRSMTGAEEDILTNKAKQKTYTAFIELLANCTIRLGDISPVQVGDINRLLEPDRRALLMAVRKESYGNEMEAELQCSDEECKHKFSVIVDLDQIEDLPTPEGFSYDTPTFTVTLSDAAGTVVEFSYLTGEGEKAVAKEKENRMTEMLIQRVKEVSGVHKNSIKQWIKKLPVKHIKELRAAIEATECGPNIIRKVDCPACESEISFAVPQQMGFFFPDK